jgi:hypothetical protein
MVKPVLFSGIPLAPASKIARLASGSYLRVLIAVKDTRGSPFRGHRKSEERALTPRASQLMQIHRDQPWLNQQAVDSEQLAQKDFLAPRFRARSLRNLIGV